MIKNDAPQKCGASKKVRNLVGHVGQQSDLTGTLDGLGQLALMHGAGAGGSAGQNLGALREETAQLGGILIINVLDFIDTEAAHLTALTAAGGVLYP